MAGHIQLSSLREVNPFSKNQFESELELSRIVYKKIQGKSLEEFGNIRVHELPAEEYVFDYEDGDRAFGIQKYPMNDEFMGAGIEYHLKNSGERIIYIVL
jgi:hypothetical protein